MNKKSKNTFSLAKSIKRFLGSNDFVAWCFLLPGILVLLVFTFYPMICGLVLAFCKFSLLSYSEEGQLLPPKFVYFDNFVRLYQDRYFWMALKNSCLYLAVVPVLQLGSAFIATCLNKPTWANKLIRTALYIPVVTSVVVVGIAWKWILRSDGLANQILEYLSLPPVNWLTDPDIALYSVMFVTLWQGLGYYMILYLAGLQAISPEFEEAAIIDGAQKWQIFFKITLPLLKPTAALCTLISCISALKVFSEIFMMTQAGPQNSTLTAVYYIYTRAFENFDMGYAAAVSLVLAVIVSCVSYVNIKFFSEGGIKSSY